MLDRRHVLAGLSSLPFAARPLATFAQAAPKRLAMPPLLDATQSGRFSLDAQRGQTDFIGAGGGETWGFNQAYLGPTLRLATGQATGARVRNGLPEDISVHWHGLLIPGEVDGGPHQAIAPGATWSPEIPLTQPAATAWYHSHVHGATGRQVQMGLAGVLQIADGQDDARGLPSGYGVDDLTLVIQDRRFDRGGRIDYSTTTVDRMSGFLGDTLVLNGQVGAEAVVPPGLVRLRLLNGSNARIYPLSFADGRDMHLIATDSGYLDRPVALGSLTIAPGERCEILVDFSSGKDARLISAGNPGQMMGRGGGNDFSVLPFRVDATQKPRITQIPTDLGGSRPDGDASTATTRQFTLDIPMGMGMMSRRAGTQLSINGDAFDMNRINFALQRGTQERWRISAGMMMHPFHIHGVSFQILSQNGRTPTAQDTGWKDTVLVNGSAELLVRFDQPATPSSPFMYHCHILEHEDGGMMGQFAVT